MKKYIVLVLVCILVLSLFGCQSAKTPASQSASSHIKEEGEDVTLTLPVSGNEIRVKESYRRIYADVAYIAYAEDIDKELLKAAEEKITEQANKYSEHSPFYVTIDGEGYLILCTEIIADIVTVRSIFGGSGCDIDHEHIFLTERITNLTKTES